MCSGVDSSPIMECLQDFKKMSSDVRFISLAAATSCPGVSVAPETSEICTVETAEGK